MKTIIKYKLNFILIIQICRQLTDCVAIRAGTPDPEVCSYTTPMQILLGAAASGCGPDSFLSRRANGGKSLEEKIA